MSTRFNGTTSEVQFPVTPQNDLAGFAYTIAGVLSRNRLTGIETVTEFHSSVPAANVGYNFSATALQTGNGTTGGNIGTVSTTADWYVVAITKAAASGVARSHVKNLTTNAAITRTNGGVSWASAPSNTGGTIRMGREPGANTQWDGWLAVSGVWRVELTDTQVDALYTNNRTTDWLNHGAGEPVHLVEWNTQTSGIYIDLGSGASNSNSVIAGTIDGTVDPPGWTYDGATALASAVYRPRRMPIL